MGHERLPDQENFHLEHFIGRTLLNAEENNLKGLENNLNKHLGRQDGAGPGLAPAPITGVPTLHNPTTGFEISQLPGSTTYLEQVFAHVGFRPDAYSQLGTVLEAAPQHNQAGYLLYLVTSGLSVDLVTGYRRAHKDVDLVLMHPDVNDHNVFRRTDNVVPQNFWAGMKLDPNFLAGTAFRAGTREMGEVLCAHPGITLVQKTSDAWGRAPREHDIHDATALGYWILKQPELRQQRDVSIANKAMLTMMPRQASKTADRLNTMFAKYDKIKRDLRDNVKFGHTFLGRTTLAHAAA